VNFRLFRETKRKYHIGDPKEPMNEFICQMSDMDNFSICSNFLALVEEKFKHEKISNKAWKMNFDCAHSRSGKGAGIVLVSPTGKSYNFAFRLEFDTTNNVVEYETLLLGLEIAKDMGIKILNIKGDSDLVILQVKNKYACKSERLKRYRNAIWDTMELVSEDLVIRKHFLSTFFTFLFKINISPQLPMLFSTLPVACLS
jgi:ribonuclease HI